MARKTAPAPEPEEAERDYAAYATKDINGKAEAYSEWIEELTGYEPDPRSVMLAVNLHMEFQGSDEWRNDERNPRSDAGKKARAAANGAETEKAPAKSKTPAKTAAKAPARRGRQPAAAKAPAKSTAAKRPASGRRGRQPASAEAPY